MQPLRAILASCSSSSSRGCCSLVSSEAAAWAWVGSPLDPGPRVGGGAHRTLWPSYCGTRFWCTLLGDPGACLRPGMRQIAPGRGAATNCPTAPPYRSRENPPRPGRCSRRGIRSSRLCLYCACSRVARCAPQPAQDDLRDTGACRFARPRSGKRISCRNSA